MTTAARYHVTGRVQGVGFRAYVAEWARDQALAGWARNLPDGSVEVHAEGAPDALDLLERQLREGPPMARVEAVTRRDVAATGASGFRIA